MYEILGPQMTYVDMYITYSCVCILKKRQAITITHECKLTPTSQASPALGTRRLLRVGLPTTSDIETMIALRMNVLEDDLVTNIRWQRHVFSLA